MKLSLPGALAAEVAPLLGSASLCLWGISSNLYFCCRTFQELMSLMENVL